MCYFTLSDSHSTYNVIYEIKPLPLFMLPDTLHELTTDERFVYAKLLAHISRIDKELSMGEMMLFEQRLGSALLSPSKRKEIRGFLTQPPSLQECLNDLSKLADPLDRAGKLALRDAVMMSAADGEIDDNELAALFKIAEHLGLDQQVVKTLVGWCQKGWEWMQESQDILFG